MATLTLRNIKKAYGSAEIIKGIDLHIVHRESIVRRPLGCGKSTLLLMIASLEEITTGDLVDAPAETGALPLLAHHPLAALGTDRGLAVGRRSYRQLHLKVAASELSFAAMPPTILA